VVGTGAEARLAGNAAAIARELGWLDQVIALRLDSLASCEPVSLPDAPALAPEESPYADLLDRLRLGRVERLIVALALAPHVRPQALDALFRVNERLGRGHSEIGGLQGRTHGGFLPTAETALFLAAGPDLRARFEYQRLLDPRGALARHEMVRVEEPAPGEPATSGALTIPSETLSRLTTGVAHKPEFSREFPARLATTELEWDDLVLAPSTGEQLRELQAWTRHESRLLHGSGLGRRLRGGYRALFYGPPGTGKTLTAALLGKRCGRDVYRIALSAVVSKYIGETEKNLERVFARAERLDCILFFDEADALFGKRTAVGNAHDRYANQEVSYLLQRVEDYRGVIILASNLESNIDEAFLRRFHAIVHFPMPGPAQRLRLWRESLPLAYPLEPGVDLAAIGTEVELSGAAILNVVQYATLMALEADSATLRREDLLAGIRRELQKEGRTP
jgi:hypothetical protein